MRVGLSKGFRNGFRKLQWRIAAWTALILLSVQIGGLFLFEHIGRSSALDEVRARLLEQRADQLAQAARVLAADYGFRAALQSFDRDTVVSALENHGSRIGARQMLLIGLHGAAPLALAGLYFATRRRNRLATDVALARRQKAPRSARANLRKAETALKESAAPAAVFGALAAAASDYFGHRLNLPPGAVEAAVVLEKLRAAQVGDEALAKWREFFALSDQIRYASSAELAPAELETWIATVTALLRKAERVKL